MPQHLQCDVNVKSEFLLNASDCCRPQCLFFFSILSRRKKSKYKKFMCIQPIDLTDNQAKSLNEVVFEFYYREEKSFPRLLRLLKLNFPFV